MVWPARGRPNSFASRGRQGKEAGWGSCLLRSAVGLPLRGAGDPRAGELKAEQPVRRRGIFGEGDWRPGAKVSRARPAGRKGLGWGRGVAGSPPRLPLDTSREGGSRKGRVAAPPDSQALTPPSSSPGLKRPSSPARTAKGAQRAPGAFPPEPAVVFPVPLARRGRKKRD